MLRISRQIWFSLVADSTYNLRIPLTVMDSATAQRYKCLIIYLWIPQTVLGSANTVADFAKLWNPYFLSNFEWYNDLGICLWNPKQHRISEKSSNVADSATNLILACCGFHLQLADCGFHLQLRIPQQLNSTIQMSYQRRTVCLWIPQTVLRSANTVADFANLPVFWAILSGTMIYVFVCGIQNSIEYQRKVALLRIPRQIWFWPVADSNYNLRISLSICGFHLQFADSTYNLRIDLQFADSTYSCGFRNSSI